MPTQRNTKHPLPAKARIRIGSELNIGASQRRTLLEDRLRAGLVRTEHGPVYLGAVADGIGGENAGERAAEMTIQGVFHHMQEGSAPDLLTLMKESVETVNAAVHAEANSEREKLSMGSTVAMAAIRNNCLYIASAGDSRVYLVRGKQIRQLTVDHTWAYEVVRMRKLSRQDAMRHPHHDDITRSVGYGAEIMVDMGLHMNAGAETDEDARNAQGMPLEPGDVVIVCSDGLIKPRPDGRGHFVEPGEMVRIVTDLPAEEAARKLTKLALSRQADDNVAVIVMEVPGARPTVQRLMASAQSFAASPLRVGLMVAGLGAAAVVVVLLILLGRGWGSFSSVPSSTGSPGKAIVEKMEGLLNYDNKLVKEAGASFDFGNKGILETGRREGNYTCLRLPEAAMVCLAESTAVRLANWEPSLARLVLLGGRVLVRLPEDYPTDHRVVIEVPGYGLASTSGSKMGVRYHQQTQKMYVDCLEGECRVEYNGQIEDIPAGSNATLSTGEDGTLLTNLGYGTDDALWVFALGQIPYFSPMPLPTLMPSETPIPPQAPLVRATDTRWPTVTIGPTDTRWPSMTPTNNEEPRRPPTKTPKIKDP